MPISKFDLQRTNMVENQVRPSDITDRRIIRAMLDLPRELFVPAEARGMAYMDRDLLVAPGEAGRRGRYLLAPRVLAKLVQHLELGESDRVLDVACATGYDAAVLARIAQNVIALDSDPELLQQARGALALTGVLNAHVVLGDLPAGYPSEGPYDAILVAGGVAEVPSALLDQLKDGGRLVTVLAEKEIGRATQWRRHGETFDARAVFDAAAVQLPGFERARSFVF